MYVLYSLFVNVNQLKYSTFIHINSNYHFFVIIIEQRNPGKKKQTLWLKYGIESAARLVACHRGRNFPISKVNIETFHKTLDGADKSIWIIK